MRNSTFSMAILAIGLACAAPVIAQQGGQTPSQPSGGGNTGGGGAAGGGGVGTRTPTTPTTPTQPRQPDFGQPQQQRQPFPETRTPVFLSGRVVVDGGAAPPDIAVIETVCNGVIRRQGYTDAKGRFSFQLGQNTAMMMDASMSSVDSPFPRGGMSGSGNSPFGRGGMQDLIGCELRASLPGYRSDMLNLAGRRALDNPEVGTIVLHRLGNVEGTTISVTSMAAPKEAQKAYEKGFDALKKKKWADAQKNLEKAVEVYPKYAAAWYGLGQAYHAQNNLEQARTAYARSLEADPKFLKPYMPLASISAGERKWEEVERYTSELLRLDPVDYAPAYFYNSVANFNLKKFDAAEKSAREGVKLDSQHQLPKMEHVLGVILANKQDYAEAAQYLKGYLEHAPNAQDADTVRKQLSEVEKFAGPPAAQAQPQQPPQQ